MPRKPNPSSARLPRLDVRPDVHNKPTGVQDDGKPRQTIVPAGTRAAPPTTAANSVFAVARPATPIPATRERVNPDTVQIISGVPLPPNVRASTANSYGALLRKMQPGDHVALTERCAKSMASHARGLGIKVALRKLETGRFGVWRLA